MFHNYIDMNILWLLCIEQVPKGSRSTSLSPRVWSNESHVRLAQALEGGTQRSR